MCLTEVHTEQWSPPLWLVNPYHRVWQRWYSPTLPDRSVRHIPCMEGMNTHENYILK